MRAPTAVVIAAALAVVAWKGGEYILKRQQSPFGLWQLHAGMRFQEANDLMRREEKRRFTCHTIVAANRLCTVRVTGIRATVRALVDEHDRIALLSFHPDSASVVLREEARKVAAEWGLVRAGVSEDLEGSPSAGTVTRWTSEDKRWSAAMRYTDSAPAPTSMRVADERAMERVAQSGPLGRLVLQANGLVDADDIDVATAIMRLSQGAGADSADFTPMPALSPDAPPPCELPVPEIPIPDDDVRRAIDPELASLLQSSLTVAYPGWQLVIGRGFWMTDPTGRSERVTLEPRATSSSGAVLAFALAFHARAVAAGEQTETLDPKVHCRAPSEIVVARRASDGSFRDARRLAFDEDALATELVRLDLAPSDDEVAALVAIEYVSAHATDLWSGWVSWTAAIPVGFAAPDSHGLRIPMRYGFRLGKGDEEANGILLVTGRHDQGLELTTFDHHSWGVASRTLVVPLDSAGALRGTVLLGKLF